MTSSLHISLTEFRNESRVLKEAVSLVNNGVVTKVYVAALHGPSLLRDQEYEAGIIVHRFSLTSRKFGQSLLAKFLKYVEYCVRICFYYKSSKVRVANVHALGLLPLGIVLKGLYGALLVYDTHELETETNGSVGLYKSLRKWLERRMIGHADLVIVVSESIADWYAREYSIKRPTVVLNVPRKRKQDRRNIFRDQLPIRADQHILLYQGGLAAGRGVSLVLEAFKERQESNVVVVFMGYGDLEAEIREAARQHSNIYFFPAVSPEVVLDYTASADIGVSLIENICLSYYYCMPNKLFEYAMAGLPVLVSNMKEMAAFVQNHQMGGVIAEFTARAINAAIDEILAHDLKKLGDNAYRAACENSWDHQEEKMLSAYAKIGLSQGTEAKHER